MLSWRVLVLVIGLLSEVTGVSLWEGAQWKKRGLQNRSEWGDFLKGAPDQRAWREVSSVVGRRGNHISHQLERETPVAPVW